MADSVRVEEKPNFKRFAGGRIASGRLHKGPGITAASASIPSKYQTVVVCNKERKGFLSNAQRFNAELNANENPGPGAYGSNTKLVEDGHNPSMSKKGTGGFVSKVRRFNRRQIIGVPGPGEYDPLSSVKTVHNFNRAQVTSNFHQPIATNTKDKASLAPAPNQYNIGAASGKLSHENNVSALAAFKSGTKRVSSFAGKRLGPSPCAYNINDNLTKNATKITTAPFKSTTERLMAPSPQPFPGPGAYHPHENIGLGPRKRHLQKHYLCISAPAMPLPPPEKDPGPGHYNVVDYEGPPKHYMSSSVFVSTTSRWQGDAMGAEDSPGPASYRPERLGKQSFIYNAKGKWMPM